MTATNISAQPGQQLTLEQKAALRCSAAFALTAQAQTRGERQALRYPLLAERGREFFVRSSARIMDETGLDRLAVATLIQQKAQELRDDSNIDEVMPSCLIMLEASGI
ncbi:hypothetical protein GRI36_00340 [Altererythrobacter gangjinensis]|uniref:Uncharacterized protein n=2 Tax=Pontixanthobacter gangjinensis TaxID=1028742 RepID=A0A6I4SI54_9SPHN|nr:hypothetical protein [Pontixanthobacter gangjinensis]